MQEEPQVTISSGALLGKTLEDLNGSPFYSFQGIPYAKPPINELRFKAPQPVDPWTGVKNAQNEGPQCLQYDFLTEQSTGEEDCLNLNVFTHQVNNANIKKPVMVWIHGGAFRTGSNRSFLYDPAYLMTEDIVLVVINYRLHILGFLTLDDESLHIPGNAGLKDMVLALKWVQQNIAVFGGDANNVTIFGESAGSAAVHYLVLSSQTKGLFHKAILQSGVANNIWACGRNTTKDLKEILKMPNKASEKDVLEMLMNLSSDDLLKVFRQVSDIFMAFEQRPFGPVVEKPAKDAFLTENPIEILKSGKFNAVPIIAGYTSHEGMLNELFAKEFPHLHSHDTVDFDKAISYKFNVKDRKLMADKIKTFYYGNETPSHKNKNSHYNLDTDNLMLREILQYVELHVKKSSQPLYFYKMTIETNQNFLKRLLRIDSPGVCHGDDIGYLFQTFLTADKPKPGSDEEIAIKRFVRLWTNFAKYGNPNPSAGEDKLINVQWKPVDKNTVWYLNINKNLTLEQNPDRERMEFWKKLIEECVLSYKM